MIKCKNDKTYKTINLETTLGQLLFSVTTLFSSLFVTMLSTRNETNPLVQRTDSQIPVQIPRGSPRQLFLTSSKLSKLSPSPECVQLSHPTELKRQ